MRTLINSTVHAALFAAAASAEAPRGGRAVQNTPAVNPDAVTTQGPYNVLPEHTPEGLVLKDGPNKADLKASYKAIDAAYDIQWGAGGIEDTQTKLEGLRGKVGERVFDVAKLAYATCEGKLNIVSVYFQALCAKAEEHIRSKDIEKTGAERPMSELIPLWGQYKSSFVKGLEINIDPMARNEEGGSLLYPTASSYRTKVQQEQAKTGSQAGQKRNDSKETVAKLEPVISGWSAKLRAAMEVLAPQLNRLTHEEQDKFADRVLALASDVKTEADRLDAAYADSSSKENQRTELPVDPGTVAAMQQALDKDNARDEKKPRKGTRAA